MSFSRDNILDIFNFNIENNTLIKAIFSNSIKSSEFKKIDIKPLIIKGSSHIQFEQFKDNKAFHLNLDLSKSLNYLNILLDNFKQIFIVTTTEEIQILQNKKGYSVKKKNTAKKEISLEHNKKKNYILEEKIAIPFLVELGIMSKDGHITKDKYNKFRQINRYLEFIEDTLNELQEKKLIKSTMKIIDFGCGKSYLTFALYHYLKNIKGIDIEVIGLDLKEDVIQHCSQIAKNLEFTNLKFLKGDIKDFKEFENVDMIFSLHACNTATDYSILKGLELSAKAILLVPCCQSEINQKIKKSTTTELKKSLSPLGNHNILLEKFSSLATDALRALTLELCGYSTKVIEFIDMEHTPKNILIKAIKNSSTDEKLLEKKAEYDRYVKFLGVEPFIATITKNYFLK